MAIEDLLVELRDIQPPSSPGWWPLAPGWWIILVMFLLVLIYWLIRRKRRHQNYFKLAEKQLDQFTYRYHQAKNKQELILSLSRWLRQVSILAFPHRQIAGLTGTSWTRFLDEPMPGNEFTAGQGHIFGSEVYAAKTDIAAEEILTLCRFWLNSIRQELPQ